MALDQYLKNTILLLGDQNMAVFNEGDLVDFINMSRGQIAGEAQCIRVMGSLNVDSSSQHYAFQSITLTGFTTSCTGVLDVRQISYPVGTGSKVIHPRAFPYFNQFILGQAAPQAGAPSVWSQYGQGAGGTIYFNLLDAPYTMSCDAVAYPVPLISDATPEALPYQWTDAVPFLSAYYAALSVKDDERAGKMWNEYQKFQSRARGQATSGVLPFTQDQAPDPFINNRLGLPQRGQGGQA